MRHRTAVRFAVVLICLAWVGVCIATHAATLTCTVPNELVTRASALCTQLRLDMQIPASRWSNDTCASLFALRGLREYARQVAVREGEEAIRQEVRAELAAFDAAWSPPASAQCGDGTLDSEFGEACDDGNEIEGDGCDPACQVEP